MIRAATVRMTTCRNVKPNKIESWRSTFAGTRARIGASVSRRTIGDHPFRSGRVRRGGDGGTGGDGAGRGARAGGDGGDGDGDGAGARRADADPRGDGGDGGSTRRGRAGPGASRLPVPAALVWRTPALPVRAAVSVRSAGGSPSRSWPPGRCRWAGASAPSGSAGG